MGTRKEGRGIYTDIAIAARPGEGRLGVEKDIRISNGWNWFEVREVITASLLLDKEMCNCRCILLSTVSILQAITPTSSVPRNVLSAADRLRVESSELTEERRLRVAGGGW